MEKDVLIVAKCNVNAFIFCFIKHFYSVLIVAKCNVNPIKFPAVDLSLRSINSSKM